MKGIRYEDEEHRYSRRCRRRYRVGRARRRQSGDCLGHLDCLRRVRHADGQRQRDQRSHSRCGTRAGTSGLEQLQLWPLGLNEIKFVKSVT